MTQDPVNNQAINMNNQGLSDILEALQLQMITIGDWILIQRATFDINVREEPYHSIQIYANFKTMTYIRRVWGISERNGELQAVEDVTDLCIATFTKSVVCSGHIGRDPGRDHLVQVNYPFNRWVSGSCLIRYAQDQGGEIIGICSECSGGVAKMEKMCMIKEICDGIEHNEVLKEQYIKCEKEEQDDLSYSHDLNEYHKSSEEECEDDWLGSDETMGHRYEDTNEIEYSENKLNVIINEDVTNNETTYHDDNKKYIEEHRKKISDESQEPQSRLYRNRNYSQEELEVARSLLGKYNGLKPQKFGGKRLSFEDNATARAAFNVRTGRQLDGGAWRKLTHKLREMEIFKGGNENELKNISKEDTDNNEMQQSQAPKYTQEELDIARSLLCKYNALIPKKFGGKRLNCEDSAAARRSFNVRTGRQLDKLAWKKLGQKLSRVVAHKVKATLEDVTKNSDILETSSSTVQKAATIKCAKCPRTFKWRSMLQRHMKKEHSNHTTERLPCEQCGMLLADEVNLRLHIKRKHSSYSDREYKCEFPGCLKAFISAGELNQHKALHGDNKFVCDQCGESYPDKERLNMHLRTKHKALPELQLKCKHCDEVFGKYCHRLWHTNLVHFPEKFKCTICQKSFGTDHLLKVHAKFHTDRSCECPECGKKMMQGQLKMHMRLHTGDLISCSYCPWKGQNKKLLFRHIQRQHKELWEREQESKEDNFKCPECGKLMMSQFHLTKHIGMKHGKHRSNNALPSQVQHLK